MIRIICTVGSHDKKGLVGFMSFSVLLQGLTMGFAYIAPIGMQNLFVIDSASTRRRTGALLAVISVTVFDLSLSLACLSRRRTGTRRATRPGENGRQAPGRGPPCRSDRSRGAGTRCVREPSGPHRREAYRSRRRRPSPRDVLTLPGRVHTPPPCPRSGGTIPQDI